MMRKMLSPSTRGQGDWQATWALIKFPDTSTKMHEESAGPTCQTWNSRHIGIGLICQPIISHNTPRSCVIHKNVVIQILYSVGHFHRLLWSLPLRPTLNHWYPRLICAIAWGWGYIWTYSTGCLCAVGPSVGQHFCQIIHRKVLFKVLLFKFLSHAQNHVKQLQDFS